MAGQGASLADRIRALPFYGLPHHLISRTLLRLTRTRSRLTPYIVRWFIRHFEVDMGEALEPDPAAYPCFNAFFTRALRADARPVRAGAHAIASPVDGSVSQSGQIDAGNLIQAKGQRYTVQALLGGEAKRAAPFEDGAFLTLYLSPRDYHRVHMPIRGELRETVYIPGRLFSVAPYTVRAVPGLFTRNERLAAVFDTSIGPLAVVLVGALNVSAIDTVWAGPVTPRRSREVEVQRYSDAPSQMRLEQGQELGRFNMGSTVILLVANRALQWSPELSPGTAVRVGQPLSTFVPATA